MSKDTTPKSTAYLPIIGVFAASILVVPAIADELDGPAGAAPEETAIQEADSGRDGWLDTIALTGAVGNDGNFDGVIVGLEYERVLGESFGIGAVVEYTGGSMDSLLLAMPLSYRHGQWRFQVAPGFADSYRGKDYVTRIGAGYEIGLDRWIISPNARIDFIDEREVVSFGVSFRAGF